MKTTARFLINLIMIGAIACVALWGGQAHASQVYTAADVRAYFSETYSKVDNKERLRTGYAMAKTIVNTKERVELMESIERDWSWQYGDARQKAEQQAKAAAPAATNFADNWGISDIRKSYGSPSSIPDPAPQYRCKPWGSRGEVRCEAH